MTTNDIYDVTFLAESSVCAGEPRFDEGIRPPVSAIVDRVRAGDDPLDVARDFEISDRAVDMALKLADVLAPEANGETIDLDAFARIIPVVSSEEPNAICHRLGVEPGAIKEASAGMGFGYDERAYGLLAIALLTGIQAGREAERAGREAES